MNGRDEVLALDELRLLVIVDNETDTLSTVDEGVPQIPEVARVAGLRPTTMFGGHPGKVAFDGLCCACHGLSVLVTGRRGDQERTFLFDVGPYGSVWKENAARLGVDLAAIELVFLSHWHFDHSGGFPEVVAAIAEARHKRGFPPPIVDLHPDRPDQRGILLPNGVMILLPNEPAFEDIEAAGGRVAKNPEPHPLLDGLAFASGPIERVTAYETGLPGHHSSRAGRVESDPLMLDERFVAAVVRGRGVSVLSACSHAGVINACLGAQKQFPDAAISLVLGGYHLAGRGVENRIQPTLADLKERIRPRLVAPGHCTGWRAKAALADAFAPGSYAPSVVGSTYVLKASPV